MLPLYYFTGRNINTGFRKAKKKMFLFHFHFIPPLHTSVSVPARPPAWKKIRLSWKCKLSSQHALALAALFGFLSSSSSCCSSVSFYFPANIPPSQCAGQLPSLSPAPFNLLWKKRRCIVHIWRALIDLYSVISPFSIVSRTTNLVPEPLIRSRQDLRLI